MTRNAKAATVGNVADDEENRYLKANIVGKVVTAAAFQQGAYLLEFGGCIRLILTPCGADWYLKRVN